MNKKDLVIVGGGPAGLAAALGAYENGITDILILDRELQLGGILEQCIHNGFGLHRFGEELTGPEYAQRYVEKVVEKGIPYKLDTMVLDVKLNDDGVTKTVTAINKADGLFHIEAKAVILAMGCRERNRGSLNTPGTRPAGVYTAGAAQKFVNIKGYMPGKKIVILGSGDIGLIMARRMTLEGGKVEAVCEIQPYSGGLTRNIVQCLDDYGIPLLLSHTITEIHGKKRVTGVTIAKVDERRNPIPGTEQYIECDTVLLSVGLIPENELSIGAGVEMDRVTGGALVSEDRQTSVPGVFACGNVLHVHDLVDYVSEESELAGKCAADFILGRKSFDGKKISVKPQGGVRYVIPQSVQLPANEDVRFYFRVGDVYTKVRVKAMSGDKVLYDRPKQKVAPGEMESILLTAEKLGEAGEEIIITVEGGK